MRDDHDHLIDGRWVGGGAYRENRNPAAPDEIVGRFAAGGTAETDMAVAAARRAFPAWAATDAQTRGDLLDAVGAALLAREAELGALLAREEGKTLREARGEVQRAGRIFRFFAGETLRVAGELLPSTRPGVAIEARRVPLGVVGLITPWNFPIAIPAWKTAPALAYGNTVVLKPADLTPASAWMLTKIIHEAGVPPGVFNLVMGPGRAVGERLAGHPDVDAVSFTGSQAVGRGIAAACARDFRKCQLEMGGKNPLVVLDDADLDLAVAAALDGGFFATGQRCTASSRVIVAEPVHDAFLDRLRTATEALVIGDPLDPATEVGPAVSEAQLAGNLAAVAAARDAGARLVCGGERIERPGGGWFMRPALFADVTPTMALARDEIFGPVVAVLSAADDDEALALANDTPFGLSAGVFTRSLARARRFQDGLRAGMVTVNLPTAGVELQAPFGGTRASSMGAREQGHYAREFYTQMKTSYVRA